MAQQQTTSTIEIPFEQGIADLYFNGLLTADEFVTELNHYAKCEEEEESWVEALLPDWQAGATWERLHFEQDADGHYTRFYTE